MFDILFDERFNKITQQCQMDCCIRFWNQEKNLFDAHYLKSNPLDILLSVILFICLNIVKLLCSSISYANSISSFFPLELSVINILFCCDLK